MKNFAPSKGPKWAQQGEKLTIEKPNKKKNENEKSSKLRVFFFQVPLPEDRYRCQAPHTDVLETLGLRGAQKWSKMVKNGQK